MIPNFRALITGGAGFIGSHLAERLLQSGHRVSVLDDLSTGSLANVSHLSNNPDFEFVAGSAANTELVHGLVEKADVVFHLAAAVGVRLVLEKPVHAIENNLFGTGVVLAAAAKAIAAGQRKLVFLASTSEVYGKGLQVPFREDDDLSFGGTTKARWAYACSKAMDEWLALAYSTEKKVPVIIARFFNTIGPRQTGSYGMVLPGFADQALTGEAISVFGSGHQTRCFCDVRDVVEAVLRLVDTPRAVGEVFNVGSSREISIMDLAEAVRVAAGSSSVISFVPYEKAYPSGFEDMARRVPDLAKLKCFTGFVPSIPLERTILDVIADRRARLPAG